LHIKAIITLLCICTESRKMRNLARLFL